MPPRNTEILKSCEKYSIAIKYSDNKMELPIHIVLGARDYTNIQTQV